LREWEFCHCLRKRKLLDYDKDLQAVIIRGITSKSSSFNRAATKERLNLISRDLGEKFEDSDPHALRR
jgi:hypothetical protein